MTRYIWYDINTGEFSNSWDEEMHKLVDDDILRISTEAGAKLIKYECLNDPEFELYNRMKIVTNVQS